MDQVMTQAIEQTTEASIKKERIQAIITIVVTAIVNIANLYGYSVDAGAVVNAVLTILAFISWIWCWWKNQNVTVEAVKSQHVLDILKGKNVKEETANES